MENIYFIASSFIVLIVSLCSGYYLKVNKVFSIFTVFLIGISSLILSTAFPFIYLRFNLTYTVVALGTAVICLCFIIAFVEWKIFIPYLESIERRYQKLKRLSNQVVLYNQSYNQVENNTEPVNHTPQTDISKQHVPDPDFIDVNEIIQNISVEDTIDWSKIGSQDSTSENIPAEQLDDMPVKEKTAEDKLVPEQPSSYQDIFLSDQLEEDEDEDIKEVINTLTTFSPDNNNQQDKTHPRLEFPKKSK